MTAAVTALALSDAINTAILFFRSLQKPKK
jgi:hypothetical protein